MLDSCHALQNYGVDRYHRPSKLSLAEELARRNDRLAYAQTQVNDLWRTLPRRPDRPEDSAEVQALPARAAGEHPLLHREERAAARALAARGGADRAQDRPVLLSAAADAGDERGLGDVLAPHAAQHAVRRGLPHRRRDDRVAEVAHQRDLPAAGRPPGLQRHQPVRARLRDVHRPAPDLRAPDRRRPRVVPADRRHALAAGACTTRCATSRTRASSASTCRPRSSATCACSPSSTTSNDEHLRVSAIHDTAGYRHVREALSRQYDLGSREPDIQVLSVDLRGDRSLTLRHTRHNNRPLARRRAGGAEARRPPLGLRRQPRERRFLRRRHDPLVGHHVRNRADVTTRRDEARRVARPRHAPAFSGVIWSASIRSPVPTGCTPSFLAWGLAAFGAWVFRELGDRGSMRAVSVAVLCFEPVVVAVWLWSMFGTAMSALRRFLDGSQIVWSLLALISLGSARSRLSASSAGWVPT